MGTKGFPGGAAVRRHAAAAAVIACAPLLLLSDAVVAQATIPLVQSRPDTGSRIRRELVRITIPATKPYAELTPEQRQAFRAQFKSLADGDDPPYPVDGLLPVAEQLAFVLADGKVGKGNLFMTVLVGADGQAKSTNVYETPDSRVSREAATVLVKTKYRPGVCAGKPCESEFPFTARFDAE